MHIACILTLFYLDLLRKIEVQSKYVSFPSNFRDHFRGVIHWENHLPQ